MNTSALESQQMEKWKEKIWLAAQDAKRKKQNMTALAREAEWSSPQPRIDRFVRTGQGVADEDVRKLGPVLARRGFMTSDMFYPIASLLRDLANFCEISPLEPMEKIDQIRQGLELAQSRLGIAERTISREKEAKHK